MAQKAQEIGAQQMRIYLHGAGEAAQLAPAVVAAETYTVRGGTDHFYVFFAQSLGASGATLADAVLATCEADYNKLQTWFGNIYIGGNINIGSLPFTVYIKPGTDGASHATCSATGLYCDAFNATDADLVRSLVVAEEAEVFMADQGAGWNCGASNGEALSRVLAAEIYPNKLSPPLTGVTFATGRSWLDSDRPDFVNKTDPTDVNFISVGCGTLFINWLRFQLGYSLDRIVQAGGATLAETYRGLTTQSDDPFRRFSSLLAAHFPLGQASGLTDDNPFPLSETAQSSNRRSPHPRQPRRFLGGSGRSDREHLVV